jgi:transposase, IS30 family
LGGSLIACPVSPAIAGRIHPVIATRSSVVDETEVAVGVAQGAYRWIRPDERAWASKRLGEGAGTAELAAALGCSQRTLSRVRQEAALIERRRSELRLSFEERERISRGIAAGESDAEIARAIGRHRASVGREIRQACAERSRYRALAAERNARERLRRPKPGKLATTPRLLEAVEAGLGQRWSPEQISRRLRLDYPDDPGMRISHETIYRSLYVQARGELGRQLAANLRSGRTRRRPRGQAELRGQITGMVPIAERPPEADERRVPGHWEGDLLIGAGGQSAVVTLVERQTRYLLLAALGRERTSEHVVSVLQERIAVLPRQLWRSLTWDQGRELSAHAAFTVETGLAVYFCDPRSPWQRGTNENTNGLLRQYLPKGSDLAVHLQEDLDAIAAELNGRPRKTLDWRTPAERMEELLR